MFSWLRKTRQDAIAKKSIIVANAAIEKFGELLEKYPGGYLDESWLPLPKSEMKTAFKVRWLIAKNEEEREWIKVGWFYLSSFQPGIGQTPLTANLDGNTSPETVIAKLGPYLEFSKQVEADMLRDKAEFEQFIETSQI